MRSIFFISALLAYLSAEQAHAISLPAELAAHEGTQTSMLAQVDARAQAEVDTDALAEQTRERSAHLIEKYL